MDAEILELDWKDDSQAHLGCVDATLQGRLNNIILYSIIINLYFKKEKGELILAFIGDDDSRSVVEKGG